MLSCSHWEMFERPALAAPQMAMGQANSYAGVHNHAGLNNAQAYGYANNGPLNQALARRANSALYQQNSFGNLD